MTDVAISCPPLWYCAFSEPELCCASQAMKCWAEAVGCGMWEEACFSLMESDSFNYKCVGAAGLKSNMCHFRVTVIVKISF